jgi:hypothetical protein
MNEGTRNWTKSTFWSLTAALLTTGVVSAQSFSYPSFSLTALAADPLQLNGDAAVPVTGSEGTSVLRLTTTISNQQSSAFRMNAISLGSNDSFSTAFSFQMANGGGNGTDGDEPPEPLGADGIVFILTTTSNNVGDTGGGAGFEGVTNSVGIKFDTYKDGKSHFSEYSDPNGNFVAVYTNGVANTAGYVPYSTTNSITTPQYYTPPTYMKNGDVWYCWIDYNGVTGELDVRLVDGTNARPASPQLIQSLSLTNAIIFGPSPKVYAGFSAATGTQDQDQDILNWQFFDDFNPTGIPALNIQSVSNGVVLQWPAAAGNFYLQQNSTLNTINWVSNSIAPVEIDGTNQVTITFISGNMFYRLVSQ